MYIVKHNSINDFIKVYFLNCFVQRHVSALVMSHLQVHLVYIYNSMQHNGNVSPESRLFVTG